MWWHLFHTHGFIECLNWLLSLPDQILNVLTYLTEHQSLSWNHLWVHCVNFLFSVYTYAFGDLIQSCDFKYHTYSEDSYVLFCQPGLLPRLSICIASCLLHISTWLLSEHFHPTGSGPDSSSCPRIHSACTPPCLTRDRLYPSSCSRLKTLESSLGLSFFPCTVHRTLNKWFPSSPWVKEEITRESQKILWTEF